MKDGISRVVNRGEFDKYLSDTKDGFQMIKDLRYTIDEVSGLVDVTNFSTGQEPNTAKNTIHDLRNGNKPFSLPIGQIPITQSFIRPAGFNRGKPKFSMNFQ
jgi:hypothetical protein